MATATLHKVLAGLLVLMATALVWTHLGGPTNSLGLPVDRRERRRAGIIERVRAFKRTDR